MMRITKGYFALACTLFATSLWTLPANASEPKPAHFAKGASSATLEGLLKGDQTINYTLRAKAGQNMSVMLKTSNPSSYFNVLPPGSKGAQYSLAPCLVTIGQGRLSPMATTQFAPT